MRIISQLFTLPDN